MWDRKEKITINKDKLLYILDFFDVYLTVSYTHLDVYKRQAENC